MTFICMNTYKMSFRSAASETTGFLLSYSCAHKAYFTPASQSNATIRTKIHIQYDPIVSNSFDLFLDFREKFSHSSAQTNALDY